MPEQLAAAISEYLGGSLSLEGLRAAEGTTSTRILRLKPDDPAHVFDGEVFDSLVLLDLGDIDENEFREDLAGSLFKFRSVTS